MSDKPIFALEGLTKTYARRPILDDVSLVFLENAKIGVIGVNGAGKSTLLRIMAGQGGEYEGEARLAEGKTVGFVPQEPRLEENLTVRGNVDLAVAPIRALLEHHEDLNEKLACDLEPREMEKILGELGRVQGEIEARDAWELDRHVETAMSRLHLPPGEKLVAECSGGERRRVALCRVLLEHPDLLLLDEPTNHLDVDSVSWLEETLSVYTGTVVVITHDRFFLDRVVGWMLEIFHGRAIPYQGNYSNFLEAKAKRMSVQEKQEASRKKLMQRELDWIRMNPKARTAKNKARIKNYKHLVDEEWSEKDGSVELHIPPGKRLGDTVLKFENVSFSYDGETDVLEKISFDLQPGDILGIVGPNGTGKTTLLKLITGQLEADVGRVVLGSTVQLCYLDQERATLDPEKTVWQEITDGQEFLKLGKHRVNSRSFVAKFNFTGSDQQQPVGTLSGGQRNRVQLAKMLRRGGNLILLDEPTNDLDLDTLRVLEEAIGAFPGCMVVVSHDRYFLDRICSRIIDLGNYEPGKYLDSL